jgi:hypothetical protein
MENTKNSLKKAQKSSDYTLYIPVHDFRRQLIGLDELPGYCQQGHVHAYKPHFFILNSIFVIKIL